MAEHRYKHATLMWQGSPLLEIESADITLTNRDQSKMTGGRRGILPAKNREQEAKISFKTSCARTGPEAAYLSSLSLGSYVQILVDDPLLRGTYEVTIREISGSDELNGDKSYTVTTEGFKIA